LYDLVLQSDDRSPETLADCILAHAVEQFGATAVRH
jgi:hypothetical protein